MVCNLLDRFGVVALQELRGVAADVGRLQTERPSYKFHYSMGPSSAIGGVLLGVHPALVGKANAISHHVLREGRLHYIDIEFNHLVLRIINVHLQELGDEYTKLDIFESIKGAAPADFHGIVVVMGDLNATIPNEGRFSEGKGLHFSSNEQFDKLVDSYFSHLTELHQDNYTHRATRSGKIVGLGRIDRMYTNLMPHDLHDRRCMGGTVHVVEDLAWPSDHVPVWASIAAPPTPVEAMEQVVPRLPPWVIKHANFVDYTEKQLRDCGGLSSDAYSDISLVKACMHMAAMQIKSETTEESFNNPAIRLHTYLKVWRMLRANNWTKITKLIDKFPTLSTFIDHRRRHAEVLELCQRIEQAFQDNIQQ